MMDKTRASGAVRRPVAYALAGFCVLVVLAAGTYGFLRSRPIELPEPVASTRPGPPEATPEAEARPKKVFRIPWGDRGWYPADPEALRTLMQAALDAADVEPIENVIALIQPHAGYEWSGSVAAYATAAIRGRRYDRVVVMGPTHSMRMTNIASVPDATHYETPLGEVPLDTAFMEALRQFPMFKCIPEAHADEHSVQIQVPFLQCALGDFKLAPIVVGQLDLDTAREMADVLRSMLDETTLVVASSDFTHFGARFGYMPFAESIPENLEKLDMASFDAIQKKDAEGFFAHVDTTGTTICGRCPIGVLLSMLPQAAEGRLLKYDTSGRMTGSYSNSVSYESIVFTGKWEKGESPTMTHDTSGTAGAIDPDDKTRLLALARAAVTYYLEKDRVPRPEDLGVAITPGMQRTMGAFVTIHKKGELRGCIGEIVPRRPICETVVAQALNAAFRDPRFSPVAASELPDLHFEISAYASAPAPVASYNDIVLGKHGMVLEKGGRSALFLPQVAPEQGWDLPTTLSYLARKAGLPQDAWREGAQFSVFEAVVFSEPKPGAGGVARAGG